MLSSESVWEESVDGCLFCESSERIGAKGEREMAEGADVGGRKEKEEGRDALLKTRNHTQGWWE